MSDHQALEQMLGYLYQVRYALVLLLTSENSDYQISIEKFDDVAFSKDDIPKKLIQVKHHIKRHGDLTDSSTDIWRTLKVWIDDIQSNPGMLDDTQFMIITTAKAPEGTAASILKNNDDRDTESAFNIFKAVCDKSENKLHEKYYKAFTKTKDTIIKKLLRKVYIIDSASNIIDTEKEIRKNIRYACIPKYEDQVFERLEGWWYRKTIEALCSEKPIFFTQNQVRSLIVSISQEYSDDNLPIEVWDVDNLNVDNLGPNERILFEQLNLICVGNLRMRTALRDYYRAFEQRASWIRDHLLYINEIDDYEQRLIDEWEHCFATMEDELAEYGDSVTEPEKAKQGRQLFSEIENKDIRIRPKCKEAFVMRGSYHILANQLKVGWHIDFFNRLKGLLILDEVKS